MAALKTDAIRSRGEEVVSQGAVSALKEATKGLLYLSETDEPFRRFEWKGGAGPPTAKKVLELAKDDAGAEIQELALDEFLGDYAEGDDENATKYQNLLKVLREHLSDIRVFKVGRVNLDVYVVGRTKEGDWAGVQTKAVET